jgi:alkanesulfonate monooxygenase SsuD/methylene tetrahydromethanopterin reductase-like flavin-dependent oxidoreductase (luciferase family)
MPDHPLHLGTFVPPAKERIALPRETVVIVKSMWAQPDTTHEGRYITLQGARCDPKPLQQPRPPIWFATKVIPAFR